MRCPTCQAMLGKMTAKGEPSVRMRGVILKASGPVAICPKCGGDVRITADFAKTLHDRIVLFRTDGGKLGR